MAQTLINVNQNQLNNENGSYAELIKNTQQAKVNLTTALVNKGANVSSSSTFTDLVNATNNLATIGGSFTAIKGNYKNNVVQQNWSRVNDRATYIIVNNKGIFAFHITSSTALRVCSLNGYDYNSNSTTLLSNTLTIDSSGYGVSSLAANCRRFYMNSDGSKLWCISSDGTKINEYALDYTGVSAENPINISISLSQELIMSSALNNVSNVAAIMTVNETKKKILIFDPASTISTSSISIISNCYIIDYSEGTTGLIKESVSGNVGNISSSTLSNFPLNLTDNILYQHGTHSLIDIIWDQNKLEVHKQILSECIGIPVVFPLNNKNILSYIEMYYDNVYNQQVKLYLIDLDSYDQNEYSFINYGYVNTLSSYTKNSFCLPQKVEDKIILTGGPICSLFELKAENNNIIINHVPCRTEACFHIGNDYSHVGQVLYSGNNNFYSFRFTAASTSISFAYFSCVSDKLVAYIYTDENNNHISFIPYSENTFTNYLDFPQTEVLVEDN